MSAARFPSYSLFTTGAYLTAASAILPHSKLISSPVLSKKSVPISPVASVGRGHTKNLLSYFCLPSVKETPGWSIDTLEPVSTIRRCHFPSNSNVREEVLCSNKTAISGIPNAFSGMPRWSEPSSLSPLTRFPDSGFLLCLLV